MGQKDTRLADVRISGLTYRENPNAFGTIRTRFIYVHAFNAAIFMHPQ